MQSINTYITEKLHLRKGIKSFSDGLDFLSKCCHNVPPFDDNFDNILKYFNKWIDHYKINDSYLSYACTEDLATHFTTNMKTKFNRIITDDEQDDYFSDCDLDGSRDYYIYMSFLSDDGLVYVYGHEDTFAITNDNVGCIFIHA